MKITASSKAEMMTALSFLPEVVLAPASTASWVTMPSGVTSKTQAITSATGKPRTMTSMRALTNHSGAPRRGNRTSATWISNHAITTYAAPTRKTLRRLSSSKKDICPLQSFRNNYFYNYLSQNAGFLPNNQGVKAV